MVSDTNEDADFSLDEIIKNRLLNTQNADTKAGDNAAACGTTFALIKSMTDQTAPDHLTIDSTFNAYSDWKVLVPATAPKGTHEFFI